MKLFFSEYIINSKFDNNFEGQIQLVVPSIWDELAITRRLLFLSIILGVVVILSLSAWLVRPESLIQEDKREIEEFIS